MVFSDTSSIEAIIEQQIQDNDEIAGSFINGF